MAKTGRNSPAMQQFFRAKERYPDALLFFRMGDFYEFFFEDAVEAARLLDLTLTSRSKTADDEAIPMAGVPHHAATGYIARLLELGKKVAICEQMADPATVKGIVPREVVRVHTPGLVVEPEVLDARAHNYLASVVLEGEGAAVVTLELSTNELRGCLLADAAAVLAELLRLEPRELVLSERAGAELGAVLARLLPKCVQSARVASDDETALLTRVLGDEAARDARTHQPRLVLAAAVQALAYADAHQPGGGLRVAALSRYSPSDQLSLDEAAIRNLELVRTLSGERRGSLLSVIDATCTAMGARALRRRIVAPLTDVAAIRRRHDAVESLHDDPQLRTRLKNALSQVADLERLTTRASMGVAGPRELAALRATLAAARDIADMLGEASELVAGALAELRPRDVLPDVLTDLAHTLVDDPPIAAGQGGVIRPGVDARIDELRTLASSSKDVVLAMEEREKKRTGISSLKIRYTRVFGYYIEITRTNLGSVPPDYRRKQTIANGERYVTDELAELEGKIETADSQARALEQECFDALRRRVAEHGARLFGLSQLLSELDVHGSSAEVAHRYGYVRPYVDDGVSLSLSGVRHPVVERLIAGGEFVPNDVRLDAQGARMMVITGPNMAGKSTTMREVALSVILAQAGCFVPASAAQVGVVDRIYTRVGASDNLAQGQSTFMVEMQEAAAILRGATARSLVVLDEIGRGTSTYDGLAIAWAIAEHLHDVIGCRTMFATHYHELCELAAEKAGVRNYNVAAREYQGGVVFLHKLVEGAANKSYGVAVAKLAGVPELVLARARALLAELERGEGPSHAGKKAHAGPQLELFAARPAAPSPVETTLRELEVDHLTPVQALVALSQLKALLS
jgi:DNA mismatch repair protein MutS